MITDMVHHVHSVNTLRTWDTSVTIPEASIRHFGNGAKVSGHFEVSCTARCHVALRVTCLQE